MNKISELLFVFLNMEAKIAIRQKKRKSAPFSVEITISPHPIPLLSPILSADKFRENSEEL